MKHQSMLRLVSWAIMLISSILLQTHTIISGDITWLMHVGQKMLAGEHYYHDFIEVNWPMAVYLYLIPVIASKLFTINFITSVISYIFILIGLSSVTCYYLLNKIFTPAERSVQLCCEIMLAFSLLLAPAYAFGQREHCLILLTLPYLLLTVLRLQGKKVSNFSAVTIGLAAGSGFLIKPFFLMLWVLLELLVLSKTKRVNFGGRPELISGLIIVLSYSFSLLLLTPDYFYQTLLLVEPTYYPLIQLPLKFLLTNNVALYSFTVLYVYGFSRKFVRQQLLGDFLAAGVIGALLIYLLQRTLWFYHLYPVLFFSAFLMSFTTASYCQVHNPFKATRADLALFYLLSKLLGLALLVSYCILTTYANVKLAFYMTQAVLRSPIYALAQSARNNFVYIFTNNIATNYPLLDYAGTNSPSGLPCLWLISAAQSIAQKNLPAASHQQAVHITEFARQLEIKRLLAHPPLFIFNQTTDSVLLVNSNALFIDSSRIIQIPALNFLPYFLEVPAFASFWQHYHYQGKAGNFKVYKYG